jgi:hypothetical protein
MLILILGSITCAFLIYYIILFLSVNKKYAKRSNNPFMYKFLVFILNTIVVTLLIYNIFSTLILYAYKYPNSKFAKEIKYHLKMDK